MINWDKRFLKKVKDLGITIDMYGRYVDDVVTALYSINSGWDYNPASNRMEFCKEKESNDTRTKEARTAEIMVKIANSLDQGIQFTWDIPGNNSNGRMPVLDLAVWVQEVNGVQQILHSFYKKPVASPFTILKRSALSFKIKKSTLLQEALRRLGNMSPILPWEESVVHLAEYSNMLRISGYTTRERYNNIKGATARHRQMMEEVHSGERESIYRRRAQIMEAKDLKGGLSAASWFLGGDVRAVLSCQATPGSVLADKIRKEVGTNKDGTRNLVMEEGGLPLTSGLKVLDPRKTEGCQFGDPECWVQGDKCSSMGCVYCVTCNTCKETLDPEVREAPSNAGGVKSNHYIGMCAVSLHNRHKTHREQWKARNKKNVMVKHEEEVHNGIAQEYTAKLVSTEKGLLHISLKEALLIAAQIRQVSMNDRMERGQGTGVVRISTQIGVT